MIVCGEMRWPPDETDALYLARVTTLVHVILPRGFAPAERAAPAGHDPGNAHWGAREETDLSFHDCGCTRRHPRGTSQKTATKCRQRLRTTTRRGSRMLERETEFARSAMPTFHRTRHGIRAVSHGNSLCLLRDDGARDRCRTGDPQPWEESKTLRSCSEIALAAWQGAADRGIGRHLVRQYGTQTAPLGGRRGSLSVARGRGAGERRGVAG